MAKNTVNANFNQIAVSDASDNVLGIRAAVANVQITGSTTPGQVLTATAVDGALQWATPSATLTYGSQNMTTATAITSLTTPGTLVQTFTIPSAGVWDVSYIAYVQALANFETCIGINVYNNATNVYVPDSSSVIGIPGVTSGAKITLTNRFILTTTGSTTFKVCGWKPVNTGGGSVVVSSTAGTSKIWWVKIG